MKIDTSELQNWPDPASLFDGASNLVKHGTEFYTKVESAHSTWKGLSSHYESPNQDLLYSALDPALETGHHAVDGCSSVALAMTNFANEVSTLKTERDTLQSEADTFNAKTVPPTDDTSAFNEYVNEGIRINGKITALVKKYQTAIDNCSNQLSEIGDNGQPSPSSSAWQGITVDTALSALGALAESSKVDIKYVNTFAMQVFNREISVVSRSFYMQTNYMDFKSWLFQSNKGGSFLSRFKTNLRETFLGPRGTHSASMTSSVARNRFGISLRHSTSFSSSQVSAAGRVAGRGCFIVGAAITFKGEYDKADQKLREQNPGMSADERRGRVIETATVRTGSQVATAAVAGAAIGSVIPVGGTAVGLAVGVGVGLAMSIPTGGGKSVGDRVADFGEGAWNALKGAFS